MIEFLESNAIWIIWIIFGLFFLIFLATAPCHAVLLMPFVGLPLFWLLPLGYALSINIILWLATPFLYRLIRRAMRRPIASGAESLIGTEAEVVSSINPNKHGKYLVRVGGELWSARCADSLRPGDNVIIAAIDGIKLVVQSHNDGSHSDLSPGEKTGQTGEKGKERGCH